MAKKKEGTSLSLLERMKSQIKIDHGSKTMDDEDCLAGSFTKADMVSSKIPLLNVALSSYIDGGLMPGIEVVAAPSGTGKTSIGLELVESFQTKFNLLKEEHLTLYFDNEFGSRDILEGFNIDKSRVLHIPITNIEDMHHNMLGQLDDLKLTDNIFIFVDSVGNLASKKEMIDALEGKSKADMTRAKTLKAFFRQVTPIINMKRVYTYFIGHVYKETGLFPKTIVSGGTGLAYAPNGIYQIGKRDVVEGEGKSARVIGHEMGFFATKSRTIKAKSKFIFKFMYGYGIEEYSGMAEEAIDLGVVEQVKRRSYVLIYKDKEIPLKNNARDKEFWQYVIEDSNIGDLLHTKYALVCGSNEVEGEIEDGQ